MEGYLVLLKILKKSKYLFTTHVKKNIAVDRELF
jgi:hypothetical protein